MGNKRYRMMFMMAIMMVLCFSFTVGIFWKFSDTMMYSCLQGVPDTYYEYPQKVKYVMIMTIASIYLISVIMFTIVNCITEKRAEKELAEKMVIITEQKKELKETVEQLQEAFAIAEGANAAKSQFLNHMSHDIRTPMNAIVGYSSLLSEAARDPEKVTDYTNKIKLSSRTLLGLIDDVLDMSRIESGRVKLEYEEFSISETLEEVAAAIKPQSETKAQNFNCEIENETGKDLFMGDKQRLSQILLNLLSNAVKYTPEEGNIDFSVIASEENGRVQMKFVIQDTGCGMSEEFQKKVFEPFTREEGRDKGSVQGTGLGMSIAKNFVDLMNGQIRVKSKPDQGCRVEVDLSFLPAEIDELETQVEMFSEEKPLEGFHFLAAEDNELNGEILQEMLAVKGASCHVVGNGKLAVEAFRKSEPGEYDVILMDIQMPVMNGYEAARAIRSLDHPEAGSMIMIAMTADAFEEDVQKAFASGMNGHLAKPVDMKAFIDMIRAIKKDCCF